MTADDHAESSQPMTDEDIINAVHNHESPSADSESSTPEDPDDLDAESNDDGVAANESEIIHTSNQFLHILDQMKASALHNQLSQEAHANIDNLSSILVQSKVRVGHICHARHRQPPFPVNLCDLASLRLEGTQVKCSGRCTPLEYPLLDWYGPFGSLLPSHW